MAHIRIIALDLDDTLLNSQKEISPANAAALYRAAEAGVEIVPTTGRFYAGMPEAVRALPFLRYCIAANGAAVTDIVHDRTLSRQELDSDTAVSIMEFLDGYDVIYDCYQDNHGYMTASMKEAARDYLLSPFYWEMIEKLRTPVPELKAFLRERHMGVQKVMLFTRDYELRTFLLNELKLWPGLSVTSSIPEDVEINAPDAHKGRALAKLAEYLAVPMEETAAFGDGLNDVTMIRMAGVGFAMANACDEALRAADRVVASADEDGVAEGIALLGL